MAALQRQFPSVGREPPMLGQYSKSHVMRHKAINNAAHAATTASTATPLRYAKHVCLLQVISGQALFDKDEETLLNRMLALDPAHR